MAHAGASGALPPGRHARASRLRVAALAACLPACLLAPPRPGAEVTDGGAGMDGAGACAVKLEMADAITATLVTTTPEGTRERLIRAGTVQGMSNLMIHDPGPGFSPTCPSAVIPLALMALPVTVEALAPAGDDAVLAVVRTGTGASAVMKVRLDGSGPPGLITLPQPLPAGEAFIATAAGFVAFGAGDAVWTVDVTLAFDQAVPGTRQPLTGVQLSAIAPTTAASPDSIPRVFAAIGNAGAYRLDASEAPTLVVALSRPCIGPCPDRRARATTTQLASSRGVVVAVDASGLLTVMTNEGMTPGTAAIAPLTGEGVIDIAASLDHVVVLEARAGGSRLLQIPWGGGLQDPAGMDLVVVDPQRVVTGRFVDAAERVLVLSARPAAAGTTSTCLVATASALEACR